MRILRVTLIAAASAMAVTPLALAADLPVKAPAVTPSPVYNWSGCYLGGNLGGVWGRSNVTTTYVAPTIPNIFLDQLTSQNYPSIHSSGVTAGGQIGCNLQSNHLVFGLESDFNYLGLDNEVSSRMTSFLGTPITNQSITTNSSISTHWMFTLRGRLGYAWDTWLVYATGGLAVARIQASSTYQNVLVTPPTFLEGETASASATRTGWTVGAGIEHAFSKNWTAKVEYLYADFGSITASGPLVTSAGPAPGFVLTHNFTLITHIARVGLNYKFTSF